LLETGLVVSTGPFLIWVADTLVAMDGGQVAARWWPAGHWRKRWPASICPYPSAPRPGSRSGAGLSLAEAPGTSSIPNVPRGCVDAVADDAHPGLALVRMRVGDAMLLARLTKRWAALLGVAPGRMMWVQMKSVALMEWPRHAKLHSHDTGRFAHGPTDGGNTP